MLSSILEWFYYVITPWLMFMVEKNIIPDFMLRACIKMCIYGPLWNLKSKSTEEQKEMVRKHVEELKALPIAIEQEKANEQVSVDITIVKPSWPFHRTDAFL